MQPIQWRFAAIHNINTLQFRSCEKFHVIFQMIRHVVPKSNLLFNVMEVVLISSIPVRNRHLCNDVYFV